MTGLSQPVSQAGQARDLKALTGRRELTVTLDGINTTDLRNRSKSATEGL